MLKSWFWLFIQANEAKVDTQKTPEKKINFCFESSNETNSTICFTLYGS
jgi:hypothetical protein